jgi:hypothetical protein
MIMKAPSEPVIFHAADLSATQSSDWIPRPSLAKKACVGIGWPATDAPTGALTIEESDSPLSTSGATLGTFTTTPAGSAASTLFTFFVTAAYVRVKYTRTSGGTAAAWTNSTGTAGTTPSITWGP